MNEVIFRTAQLKGFFEEEFKDLKSKFEIFELSISEAKDCSKPNISHPGVYIFWHPERGAIKVGKHFTNSRKRALEHVQENVNTGGTMALLRNCEDAKVLLFNLIDQKELHWVIALEVFFELKLREKNALEIRSGRVG